jgi:hypothetical protein
VVLAHAEAVHQILQRAPVLRDLGRELVVHRRWDVLREVAGQANTDRRTGEVIVEIDRERVFADAEHAWCCYRA